MFQNIEKFTLLGYAHVIPFGFDHILFIISIYFLSNTLKSIVIQCAAFTVAHSITLGLSAAGFVATQSAIIEPLIAFSILITALQNIVKTPNIKYSLLIVFIFGLIHGLGFASALKETGMLQNNFLLSLISFNLGVELAQISIIMALYIFITKQFAHKSWYSNRIVLPISSVIACIAVYWTIERILAA
jgi:hypothetical protein